MNIRHNLDGLRRRSFEVSDIRLQENGEGKMPTVVGHAAVFNQLSKPIKTKVGEFVERIMPGAFKNRLDSGAEIMSLRQHNPGQILARKSAQTLKLWEDEKGLAFEFTPPDTTAGRDTVEDVKHGNIRGMSFGFDDPGPGGEKWERINGQTVHTLIDVPIKEISPTGFPAYEGTDLQLRSEERAIEELNTRGQTPGYSSVASACRSAMGQCRSMWDTLHSTSSMMQDVEEGTLSDGETQNVRDMHQQMQHLSDKLTECMRSCEPHLVTDAQRSDESLRSMLIIQRRAELGLLTTTEREALAAAHQRAGHMTHGDGAPTLNAESVEAAQKLIDAGKINNGAWSFTADDEKALLGDNDWEAYARWHLGLDKNADGKTRGAYKYPYGKGGEVYTAALRAIRSRSSPKGAQPAKAIYDAAGGLLDAINKKLSKSSDGQ